MNRCPHRNDTHGTPVAEQRVEHYEYWAIYRINDEGEREWWARSAYESDVRWRCRSESLTEARSCVEDGDHVVHVRVVRRVRSKP